MCHQPPDDTVTQRGTPLHHGERSAPTRARVVPHRRTVVALVIGRVSRARLRGATNPYDELLYVDTVAALRDAVQRTVNAMTVVVEAKDSAGEAVAPFLHELVSRMPAVATIGYVPDDISSSSNILDLANGGVDQLLQEGFDDTAAALRSAYVGSIEACAARTVRAAVGSVIPKELRALVGYCLQYPREDLSIDGLARALGCDRKTLLNRCSRTQMPSPSELVMWCRLLLASAMLESTGYPVERVATQLEFASPSAFRNVAQRYTGERPSKWRAAGGLDRVVRRFLARLESSTATRTADKSP